MILKNRKYRQYLTYILISTGILCSIIVLTCIGSFNFMDGKLYDLFFNIYRQKTNHCDDVVIVCIDQQSIDFFEKNGVGWPWPRTFHCQLVNYLSHGKPRAIVFDVLFSEQDIYGEECDDEFAVSVYNSKSVYLSAVAQGMLETETVYDSNLFVDEPRLFNRFSHLKNYHSVSFPIEKLTGAAKSIGLVNIEPDSDGIHRSYPLVYKINDRYINSLAYMVAKGVMTKEMFNKNVRNNIRRTTVFDEEGKFLIHWYGEGGTGRGKENEDGVFTYYSYHALIASSIQMERGEKPLISPDVFDDKIVLIGSNAAGLFELKATPFTHMNLYPGTEIHATAIENLLSGNYIIRMQNWMLYILMIVSTIILVLVNSLSRQLRYIIAATIIIVTGELIVSFFLLSAKHIWIYPAKLLVTASTVFFGLIVSGYIMESNEKKFIHDAFGKYLAPTVVDHLIDNPEMLNQIDGERREITIYFSDIEKFTTISEALGPERLVRLVNEYFEDMTDIIQNHRGTVDRFEGDAIMAFYGAPIRFDNHAELACIACIEMQKKLRELRAKWHNSTIPDVYTRMGINSGPVMVGNMGSYSRKQYSIIGDPVNLASRLESLNKLYGTYIMIGENTYEQAKNAIEVRELDIVRVVGKKEPVRIYELLGEKGDLNEKSERIITLFANGISSYRNRNWDEAIAFFNEILSIVPDDGPSKVYHKRCSAYKLSPPAADWDTVIDITIK
ncbi:adenylate/guanylate cyclase domain-containing protein [bacterium]|nr:adenylate/guanylate cyclase domain-containing protein [bacterium]